MPKSKRNKVVHLTKVKKKGKDHKEDLIKQLEQHIDKYARIFVFDFENAKADRIMELRLKLKEVGPIFSGKNSLASLALKNIGDKNKTNFETLVEQIRGHRGLLFTDMSRAELQRKLDDEIPEFNDRLVGYSLIKPSVKSEKKSTKTSFLARWLQIN